jgi:Membrane protein involved in colicin uptake
MNLQEKLDNSLNELLRTSGYIFEIINNNKKQSNLITGTNNQLIAPTITNQLAHSITKFDDILDDTIGKFNDAKWCVEQMLENKQRQEEMKLKEEMERQKRVKEEEERKLAEERRKEQERRRKEEEDEKRREEEDKRKAEAAAAAQAQREAELARLDEARREQQREQQRKEEQQREQQREEQRKAELKQLEPTFNDFMSPGFDFNINDLTPGDEKGIPNPTDILSGMPFTDKEKKNVMAKLANNEDLDLDMNNLLGNDELILDGLNMSLLDQGFDVNNGQMQNDDEFDVDNFLNQFGGTD